MIEYNELDVDYLGRAMRAEAIGEGEYGMLLVGNVIINRVLCNSPDFKNATTIQEIIFQTPGGFACINSNLFRNPSTTYEKKLALRVIKGEKFWPATRALWYYAPEKGDKCLSTWLNQKLVSRYKNHCFYAPEEGQC
ncbi:MAG: cell wall hydrolase [Bacilli bacterium]|nr:cell wall hydrolase [Bacilli bacterium]MDD4406984.1 cell wall hydrolase [Bacilli bacterium]